MKHLFALISTLLLCSFFTIAYAQPANDVCSGAITIPVSSNSICGGASIFHGTTNGATDNNETGDCTIGTEKSVWYKFVATNATTTLTIAGDLGFDPVVQVHTACGTATNPAGGDCTDLTGSGGTETLNLAGLTVGNTYFIQIHDYQGDNTASSTFTICATVPDPPLTNNTCAGAITLTEGASCNFTRGSTAGATDEDVAGDCTLGIENSVWYKFVATDDTAIVSVTGIYTNSDMVIAALNNCGSTIRPTGGGCTDNTTGGGLEQMTLTGLTVGNTYFIQVHDYYGIATDFDICVSKPIVPTGVGGATCAQQKPVCTPLAFTAATGTTAEAGNNYGCLASQPNPTWFYAKLDTNGIINMQIASNSDIDFAVWGPYPGLAAATLSCGNLPAPISCSYSTSATETTSFTGAAGDVFIILVTNYSGASQNIAMTGLGGTTGSLDCSIVVLPVQLTSFSAVLQNNKTALLSWSTSQEINTSHFIIEKSIDGQNWADMAKVAATNSSIPASYSSVDPAPANGINYYRLKSVGRNGEFSYSYVRTVKLEAKAGFTLSPSPAKSLVKLKFDKPLVQNSSVRITNNEGQAVLSMEINKGVREKNIDISTLARGVYNFTVINENGSSTKKLVIN